MNFILRTITILSVLIATEAFAGKILYIGDSHSTAPFAPFGSRMNELLRTLSGAEVSFHSRCGSTVNWWYQGTAGKCGFFDQEPTGEAEGGMIKPAPDLVTMLDKFKPTFLFVQLGANYKQGDDWASLAKKDIPKLVDDISKRAIPCLWVGPPDYRLPINPEEAALSLKRRNELIEAIRLTVEPACTFVDSTTMTRYPSVGGDGYHYSSKEGIPAGLAWAETVFNQLVTSIYKE